MRAAVPAPHLTITPASGAVHVHPGRAVTVAVTHGKVENVTLITTDSEPVAGSLNAAGTVWHSTAVLHPSRHYTVTATAAGGSGKTVTMTSSFRTLKPSAVIRARTLLGYHKVYGVGIPIMITFDRPVRYRAAVERSIEIWSSKPVVGAWYWDGSKALDFRPRGYWPQNTHVRFVAHLAGVETSPGVYGAANLSQSFTIGRSLIAMVNTASHYATIYYRDKRFGVWPMSSGAPGDDTANGTYLTIEKGNPVLMSGPGYTNFPVPYSVRFTWSGNYMHDAYWSVAEQGVTNVSHGCVNLSPAHAAIYYNLAVPGDPVTVTRSPVAGAWDDGWTEWFLSWKQLLHGSATHQAVRVGPAGSRFVSPSSLPAFKATAPLGTSRPGNANAS
ncbi:MAG: L,D-transpeptidase family protein [Actinobacteria bacterium]|nr:L,D-transpeptidase family protein [Actinomycetota bacterium]